MIVYLNMFSINRRRNAYKANVLLFLLSSLITRKSIYNTALILLQNEALGIYVELTDAKIWISKNALLCRVLANCVTFLNQAASARLVS